MSGNGAPGGGSQFDQIQKELHQIILDVIGDGLHSVPDDVPILDLGVSSLALVEGMRRVYDQFGVLVSIRRIIEGQVTLGGLALYIEQELSTTRSQPPQKAPVEKDGWKAQRTIPLAASQRHIGFLCRYSNEANASYNETLIIRLTGHLDGLALHAAVEATGDRYEALRTILNIDNDVLTVGLGEPLDLVVSPVFANQLEESLVEVTTRPFEVGRRLFRAELLRISEQDHVLALVGHALVLDQQALEFVLADIAALYGIYARNGEAGVAPSVIQWTDYQAMGESEAAHKLHRASEIFWKEQYASEAPRLELPTDFPRPAIKQYRGNHLALQLDQDETKLLQDWAVEQNLKLSTVILAAFTVYLHRISDQKDFIIGVESDPLYPDIQLPVVARRREFLPIRSVFDSSLSFLDHVRQQAKQFDLAQSHRHFSLAELIQALNLARDQSRSALFTAAFHEFILHPAPIFEGVKSQYLLSHSAGARYDIDLGVVFAEKRIWLICDYSSELFEASTITHWLEGIRALLYAGLADSNQLCGLLTMMPPQEREQILFGWNQTEKSYPHSKTVLDFVLEQARLRKDRIAVHFGDTSLTYGGLEERIRQIAEELQRKGVKRGDRIGIYLKRSLDLIPSALATWQVGAMYVPMDFGFPSQRLAFMLEDASVQAVITSCELLPRIQEAGLRKLITVDEIDHGYDASKPFESALGSDSAMILFTSGSTGRPKGVEIRHDALLNSLLANQEYLGFGPEHSMLALTTITFDVSEVELFMPLMAGGCVEVSEEGLVSDGIRLAERIDQRNPTHIQTTPSTYKTLLTAGWKGNPDVCLISCGEALSRELAEQVLSKCRQLWNMYGPTETTIYSAAYHVTSDPGKPMRIGRPFPNTQIYILDAMHQPVPIGVVGELYIGGEGLAAGYWQRQRLTEERFVPNPFRSGEKMYRTGDLARYLPNGDLIWLGRVDDQVKIHGVRIELGEVEAALRNVPGVSDAVATSWRDVQGDLQLVGHVILEPSKNLSAAEIRSKLRERLPEVMVPPHILLTDVFPLTANGKVQRTSLPSPNVSIGETRTEQLEAPVTPTEKKLAGIWAEVLHIDPGIVGRDSDFMELGGHSLLMTLLMVEVRKMFQIRFNLPEFFRASSLRKFAALVDTRQKDLRTSARPIRRATHNVEWARQRMAFLQREARLPLYIAPGRSLMYQPHELRIVFMTGSTGFLGAYLVAEILKTTQAELYCLVRPKRTEDGKVRIEQQMRKYAIWEETETWQQAWGSRLKVVEGDVTLPRMGLPDPVYEFLAHKVDGIFHGAAHVNFIYPYEALRATNVLGLHEIIQFAFHARIKPIHHLSTAAIWPMGAENTYYEKDSIDHHGLLNLGYDEAKWVGEKCLINAEERGLPVARYRPGEVGGDSQTGRCVTDHFLIASVKGFLQFRAFPQLDIRVDVAPVDYVAKAMVFLAFQRKPLGRAFHLTNPNRGTMREALNFLRGLGYQFDELPFEELRDRLVNSPDFSRNALFAYQAALEDMDNISMQLPNYDTRQTRRELEASGIVCPPTDEKLYTTYLRYLQKIGFLPLPEGVLVKA